MLDAINTNVIAMSTENNLANSQASLATSIQRLSSGLRINSASDDPAGLAIASRMSSQLSGLTQATLNANNGVSMLQTADGGLASTTQLLQSMRSLAVEAANGTNSSTDLASLQTQMTQLQAQVQQVSTTTQYNGTNLLDGSLSNIQFQVGANAGQTISFGIANAQQTALGNNVINLDDADGTAITDASAAVAAPGASPANNVKAQTLTLQGNGNTSTVAVTAGESAQNIASGVNQLTATTGVTATSTASANITFAQAGTYNLSINGFAVSTTFGSSYAQTATDINAQSGNTGVTATVTGSGVTLSNTTGADIDIVNNSSTAGNTVNVTGTYNSAASTGSDTSAAQATAVTLGIAGASNATAVGGNLVFSSQAGFSITSSAGGGSGLFAATTANGSTLDDVAGINLTTTANGIPTGANSALTVIDAAIAQVNTSRASIGALENRFTASVSNLQTSSLNLTSSLSTEQDTNFASETSSLSRAQILQQAGTAMLAQANSLPNGVLALLR